MSTTKGYPIYQIDTDGDLKFLHYLDLKFLPRIGDTIALVLTDNDGKPNRRIYYKVRDIIIACAKYDDNVILPTIPMPIIHVSLEIDEPV